MKHTTFAKGNISTSDRTAVTWRLQTGHQHGPTLSSMEISFRVFWTFSLQNADSGRAAASCCVSQTGRREKIPNRSPRVL